MGGLPGHQRGHQSQNTKTTAQQSGGFGSINPGVSLKFSKYGLTADLFSSSVPFGYMHSLVFIESDQMLV
jgi:hypothetical protein